MKMVGEWVDEWAASSAVWKVSETAAEWALCLDEAAAGWTAAEKVVESGGGSVEKRVEKRVSPPAGEKARGTAAYSAAWKTVHLGRRMAAERDAWRAVRWGSDWVCE